MLAIAFGVLVVAGVGAAAIARETSSSAAIKDLKEKAPTVATDLTTLGRRLRRVRASGQTGNLLCRLIGSMLNISGGSLVAVTPDGTVQEGVGTFAGANCAEGTTLLQLPHGLRVSDLKTPELLDGKIQSGERNGTVFVATPLDETQQRTPVLVLTDSVETRPLGRAGGFLLWTGAFALVVAAVISAVLARRLTRPIAAMQATAGRIAGGDLSARVGETDGPNDELATLARSIDTMADELETARGHEHAFLLSISHDLRTPLTSIRGYAEAIADRVIDTPDDRARAAGVITAEARRLERLVADLLDLARLDAREFSLAPRPVDARSVVGATVQGFSPAAQQWGVQLQLTPGDPVQATIDPERLAQIVANLVENALKYAKATVVVDVAQRDEVFEVRVDDDGPGIDPAERDRVFQRLYTARGTEGRQVGTGIGLAIVHELAHAMAGDARCDAGTTGGSRFIVTLPVTPR